MDQARLEQSTRENEGFRSHPYLDTRRLWTFGIGRCLETNPLKALEWRYLLATGALKVELTEEGAEYLMRRSLDEARKECEKLDVWALLEPARQNVLVEMAYQMGIDSLRQFKKMFMAIRRGDFYAAAEHGLDSKWAKEDSPERAKRMMRQFRYGRFP